MKAKKTLSLLLCASVIVGMLGMMSGCSNSTSQSPSPSASAPAESAPAETGTASLLDQIKSSGVMVVGTSATNAPWESIDADGNYVGYDMDLINEIASRMGVEVQFEDLAFDA